MLLSGMGGVSLFCFQYLEFLKIAAQDDAITGEAAGALKMSAQDDAFTGESAEIQKQQDEAYQLYQQLLDSFAKTGSAKEDYPDYYSGAYIDDNSHLVVLIKEGTETEIQNIVPLSDLDSYSVETRRFSLNELNLANRNILEFVSNYENGSPEQKALIERINTVGVSQKDNKIYINTDRDISDNEKIILLNQVTDSDIIEFVNEPKMVEAMDNLQTEKHADPAGTEVQNLEKH